jgi:hypothetical protein
MFPTPQKLLNLVKKWGRNGVFGVMRFNVQLWVNQNKLKFKA